MLKPATSPPHTATLILLAGLSVLSLNMFLPSLAHMAEAFGVSYATASLAIGAYLAATAVLQLVIGPLSDRYGRRPIMLIALVLFTAASLGCLLAQEFWLFLTFRLIQGMITAGWLVSMAIIRDTSEPQEAASLIGYVTMAMAVAPMVGPMVGGVLAEFYGWRANFVVYLVAGALLLAISWANVGETNQARSETFASQARNYPELFTSRRFWGYSVCMAFSTGAFYSFLAGIPLVAETVFKLSTSHLGIAMGSITGGFMTGSFLSGRYSKRFAITTMVLAGRIAACGGLAVGLVLWFAGITHLVAAFGAVVMVGLGNGLSMPGCSAGVLSVRPKLAGSASGLAGALTVGGGGALSALTSWLLTGNATVPGLLAMMLVSSAVGLLAVLYVMWVDRRETRG